MQGPIEVIVHYTNICKNKGWDCLLIAGFQSVAQHVDSDIHPKKKLFPIFDCAGTVTLVNKYSFRVDAMRNAFYVAGQFLSFQTVSSTCRGRFSLKTAH